MKLPGGKTLLKIGVAAVILFVATIVVALLAINGIARHGIEAGGTYALGVDTTLKSASVGVFSGTFSMAGLNVANPKGFKGPHFMNLGEGSVAVSLGSLMSSTIELPSLTLTDLSVSLEKQGGKSNYQEILDHLGKLSGPKKAEDPNAKKDGGKQFVIKEVVLKNIKIHAELLGDGGVPIVGDLAHKATSVNIPIDEIRLTNVGQSGVAKSGASMEELVAIIVKAVFAAAIDKGGGLLPGDMLGDLQGGLKAIGGLGDVGINIVSGGAKEVLKAAEGVGDVGKKAADEGKKAVEGLGEGIKGLIPGGGEKKPPGKP